MRGRFGGIRTLIRRPPADCFGSVRSADTGEVAEATDNEGVGMEKAEEREDEGNDDKAEEEEAEEEEEEDEEKADEEEEEEDDDDDDDEVDDTAVCRLEILPRHGDTVITDGSVGFEIEGAETAERTGEDDAVVRNVVRPLLAVLLKEEICVTDEEDGGVPFFFSMGSVPWPRRT